MLPHLPGNIRGSVQPMPGLKIEITEDCTGCEACTQDVCFVHAIEIINGRAVVNGNCVVCGRCVDACPVGAIDLRIVDRQYAQSTIDILSALVELD
jgi:ferredoxin